MSGPHKTRQTPTPLRTAPTDQGATRSPLQATGLVHTRALRRLRPSDTQKACHAAQGGIPASVKPSTRADLSRVELT